MLSTAHQSNLIFDIQIILWEKKCFKGSQSMKFRNTYIVVAWTCIGTETARFQNRTLPGPQAGKTQLRWVANCAKPTCSRIFPSMAKETGVLSSISQRKIWK